MSTLKKPETPEEWRAMVLSFIGSLTLADHTGDMSSDIADVLKTMEVNIEWDDLSDLGRALGKMGVKTLHGTEL